eukprot:TRINITY_DN1411_c0_g1::TRINITY_DN1411_c0_g1_i1::g.27168::m.27168 TRINITY_DN1411_c0_g1::TRINITY_DN1411_c0_g1_i1::g.27168  ORF type:complete len:143 (+),score=-15.21,zf-RING_5/PF14634.1/4.9 TRINITY_DN1411_c0_g1_i1:305-733(+)
MLYVFSMGYLCIQLNLPDKILKRHLKVGKVKETYCEERDDCIAETQNSGRKGKCAHILCSVCLCTLMLSKCCVRVATTTEPNRQAKLNQAKLSQAKHTGTSEKAKNEWSNSRSLLSGVYIDGSVLIGVEQMRLKASEIGGVS